MITMSFEDWKRYFDKFLNEMVDEMTESYLDVFGLKVVFDDNYNFGRKRWLAVYQRSKNPLSNNEILISINYPHIYKLMMQKMKNMSRSNFIFNVEAQAKITVGHEIGHALVEFLVDYCDAESEDLDEFVRDYYDGVIDEEELVEEFGRYQFPEATGVWSSELDDYLNKIVDAM